MRRSQVSVRLCAPSTQQLSVFCVSDVGTTLLTFLALRRDQDPDPAFPTNHPSDARIQVDLALISIQLRFTTGNLNVFLKSDYPGLHIIHTFSRLDDFARGRDQHVAPHIDLLDFLFSLRVGPQQGQQNVGPQAFVFLDDGGLTARDELLFCFPVFQLIPRRNQALIGLNSKIVANA